MIEKGERKTIFSGRQRNYQRRTRFGIVLALIGFVVFLVGAAPNWIGLDRSPVIGFVQIAVFLVGLGLISVGGYWSLVSLWRGTQLAILADIGSRLISTGYVISVASGMADVFGFGSEALPLIPVFGIWQMYGVMFGEIVIAIGMVLLIPWKPRPLKEPPNNKPAISIQTD